MTNQSLTKCHLEGEWAVIVVSDVSNLLYLPGSVFTMETSV